MVERTLSVDEKIRRAEEIYNRRMNAGTKDHLTTVSVSNKRDYKLMKKMIFQIITCFIIYLIYYLCQNSTYIFSEEFLNKTKEVLSYNIDVDKAYEWAKEIFERNIKVPPNDTVENIEENTVVEDVKNAAEDTNTEESDFPEVVNTEETLSATEDAVEETSSISQMELDVNEIKSKVEMRKPLIGTVTSRFGARESSEIVSSYHQGIDIAANLGTKIACAMEGDVTLVSSEGGYGKQIRIANGDILTIYGHCNEIYVKEGEHINLGQEIGEVGETGNATGPHLHFEVRFEERLVDPENILGEL